MPTFWGRLRLDGVTLHGMPMVDACCITLSFFERHYPEEPKRVREFKRLAEAVGIEIVEDAALVAARHAAEMAKVMAELGGEME